MLFRDVFHIAASNARRSRARAWLTGLSIAIGVSSVMLISSLGDSGQKVITNELDKLGINGITVYSTNTEINPLTAEDAEYLENTMPEVACALPLVIEYGSYRLKNIQGNTVVWGVDSEIDRVLDIELLHGRLPNRTDIQFGGNVAVIDDALAQKTYQRDNVVGKSIMVGVGGATERFEIIGVIRSQQDGINQMVGGMIPDFMYIPYTTANRMRSSSEVSQIAIKCASGFSSDTAGQKAAEVLGRSKHITDGYATENMTGHVNNLKSIAGLVALLLSAVAAISLCVGGLGIMNTMLSSTAERKKEIGICMAIGAKRSDIAICFLTESALVSAIGGSIGALIGLGLSWLISVVLGMPTAFSLQKLLIAEAVSIFCGIIFAVIPAVRASKLDPIVALRDE